MTHDDDYEKLWADVLERHQRPPFEDGDDDVDAWATEVLDDWIAELRSRGESKEYAVEVFNSYPLTVTFRDVLPGRHDQ